MIETSADLGFLYAGAFATHLRAPDETSLRSAYEIGRRAMAEGLGILDLVEAHQRATETALGRAASAEESARVRTAAAAFLLEALSPFEMTLRGYREANQTLRDLNADLHRAKESLLRIAAEAQIQNVDLKRAKESADVANRELEAFSYSVAHDLRAPLRSIDGFSQALLDDFGPAIPPEGQEHLRRVRAASQRMGQLIDDLLGLSRIARATLDRRGVDLTALARSVGQRLAAASPNRRVQLIVVEGLVANGDPGLLEVVVTNLLGNAWKFTAQRAEAHVVVGSGDRDGEPAFFVRDDGVGFDPSYAGKLFAPFQRLHAAKDFEGTGIGLATVQRVVHRHGGRIWAESEVGKGATFYFTLGRAIE